MFTMVKSRLSGVVLSEFRTTGSSSRISSTSLGKYLTSAFFHAASYDTKLYELF